MNGERSKNAPAFSTLPPSVAVAHRYLEERCAIGGSLQPLDYRVNHIPKYRDMAEYAIRRIPVVLVINN